MEPRRWGGDRTPFVCTLCTVRPAAIFVMQHLLASSHPLPWSVPARPTSSAGRRLRSRGSYTGALQLLFHGLRGQEPMGGGQGMPSAERRRRGRGPLRRTAEGRATAGRRRRAEGTASGPRAGKQFTEAAVSGLHGLQTNNSGNDLLGWPAWAVVWVWGEWVRVRVRV